MFRKVERMETKTVDVIIPVYKPGEELKELLSRLMKQSILPEHIFILQTIEEGTDSGFSGKKSRV